MAKFSEDEYWILNTYKEALQLVFDYGKWRKINDENYWIVPARIKNEVEDMIETMKDDFDL